MLTTNLLPLTTSVVVLVVVSPVVLALAGSALSVMLAVAMPASDSSLSTLVRYPLAYPAILSARS